MLTLQIGDTVYQSCNNETEGYAKLKDVMGFRRIFIPVNYWLTIPPPNRGVRLYGAPCHLKTGDFFGCEANTQERRM